MRTRYCIPNITIIYLINKIATFNVSITRFSVRLVYLYFRTRIMAFFRLVCLIVGSWKICINILFLIFHAFANEMLNFFSVQQKRWYYVLIKMEILQENRKKLQWISLQIIILNGRKENFRKWYLSFYSFSNIPLVKYRPLLFALNSIFTFMF